MTLSIIQIQASKLVCKLPRNSNADQINKLKVWKNISFYYSKRLLVEAHQSYHGSNIDVLNDLVRRKHSSYCLGTTMSIKLRNPEIGRMTFRHRAAIAWNSLTDSSKIALL